MPVYQKNPNDHPADPGVVYRLMHLNPALYRGLVVAVFFLLATVGVKVTPGLPDALIGVLAVLGAMAQAVWTRGAVTANDKVVVYLPDPIEEPQVVAPGPAITTATPQQVIAAAETVGTPGDGM